MSRMVKCVKLGKEAGGLDRTRPIRASWANAICENVSKEAWQMWLRPSDHVDQRISTQPNGPQVPRIS